MYDPAVLTAAVAEATTTTATTSTTPSKMKANDPRSPLRTNIQQEQTPRKKKLVIELSSDSESEKDDNQNDQGTDGLAARRSSVEKKNRTLSMAGAAGTQQQQEHQKEQPPSEIATRKERIAETTDKPQQQQQQQPPSEMEIPAREKRTKESTTPGIQLQQQQQQKPREIVAVGTTTITATTTTDSQQQPKEIAGREEMAINTTGVQQQQQPSEIDAISKKRVTDTTLMGNQQKGAISSPTAASGKAHDDGRLVHDPSSSSSTLAKISTNNAIGESSGSNPSSEGNNGKADSGREKKSATAASNKKADTNASADSTDDDTSDSDDDSVVAPPPVRKRLAKKAVGMAGSKNGVVPGTPKWKQQQKKNAKDSSSDMSVGSSSTDGSSSSSDGVTGSTVGEFGGDDHQNGSKDLGGERQSDSKVLSGERGVYDGDDENDGKPIMDPKQKSSQREPARKSASRKAGIALDSSPENSVVSDEELDHQQVPLAVPACSESDASSTPSNLEQQSLEEHIEFNTASTPGLDEEPKEPKEPLDAFAFYAKETEAWGGVSRDILSTSWQRLSPEERSKYEKQARLDKERYRRERQAYDLASAARKKDEVVILPTADSHEFNIEQQEHQCFSNQKWFQRRLHDDRQKPNWNSFQPQQRNAQTQSSAPREDAAEQFVSPRRSPAKSSGKAKKRQRRDGDSEKATKDDTRDSADEGSGGARTIEYHSPFARRVCRAKPVRYTEAESPDVLAATPEWTHGPAGEDDDGDETEMACVDHLVTLGEDPQTGLPVGTFTAYGTSAGTFSGVYSRLALSFYCLASYASVVSSRP